METKQTPNGETLNVLQRAQMKQAQFAAALRDAGGYECFTTFYADLTIAEGGGLAAVRETYNRVFESWRDNFQYWTEFVLSLNWKIWEHHGKNDALARLYNELWEQADAYALDNYTGEAIEYFLQTTD